MENVHRSGCGLCKQYGGAQASTCSYSSVHVCVRVEQLALLLLLPWCGQMFVESFPEKKALSCKHFNNTLSFLQTDMV